MDNQTIRVLIVDDHSMVRQGIKILLEQFEGIQVIGEAANGQEGIRLVEELNPDLVLMDLSMPVHGWDRGHEKDHHQAAKTARAHPDRIAGR